MRTEDGDLIVGLRQRGKIGHQVCLEVKNANGRLVRKLLAGGEVGLLDVARYKNLAGYKNLAEGQAQWTYKDREDFEELLFVTESKRKSLYGNSRDPNADCCVKFHSKGIQILTVSSFMRVLGNKSAKSKIEKACARDGILPPWEAELITEANDPRREKRRRNQGRRSVNDAGEAQGTNNKVMDLENRLSEMTKQMAQMAQLLKNFQATRPATTGDEEEEEEEL